MNKFANFLRREQGFTLIELIAALSLFSLVAGLIYGVMMFGVQSYQRVTMENTLRDESDLLMSAIITEMYTFAPTAVYEDSSSIFLQKENADGGLDKVEIAIAGKKLKIKEIPAANAGAHTEVPDPAGSTDTGAVTDTYDTRTTTDSELGPASFIKLECSAGAIQPCESGLLNINLSLVLQRGDDIRTLDLESKFGF
ncbi:hypothetical protein D3C76_72770 [compost metagenome]